MANIKINIEIVNDEIHLSFDGPETRKFNTFCQKLLSFIEQEFPRFVDYHEYLQSLEWLNTSKEAKKRAGYKCQRCGFQGKKDKHGGCKELHTHHLTYDRLGRELPEDLEVLCIKCHQEDYERTPNQ